MMVSPLPVTLLCTTRKDQNFKASPLNHDISCTNTRLSASEWTDFLAPESYALHNRSYGQGDNNIWRGIEIDHDEVATATWESGPIWMFFFRREDRVCETKVKQTVAAGRMEGISGVWYGQGLPTLSLFNLLDGRLRQALGDSNCDICRLFHGCGRDC
jgi:hypothetical protein